MMRMNHWMALLILVATVSVPTFMLIGHDMLTKSETAPALCLEKNRAGYSLCATCVSRKELKILDNSNIIFSSPSEFKAMKIKKEGLLECR